MITLKRESARESPVADRGGGSARESSRGRSGGERFRRSEPPSVLEK